MPKPPKSSNINASSLLHVSSHPCGEAETGIIAATPGSSRNQRNEKGNSVVKRKSPWDNRGKNGPDHQRLDELHSKTVKGSSALPKSRNRPSLDFSRGEKPRPSFLSQGNNDDTQRSRSPSSDWESEYLPSPSAMFATVSNCNHKSFRSANEDPCTRITSERNLAKEDTLENFDLSQSDDVVFETEAAVVGLDDRASGRVNPSISSRRVNPDSENSSKMFALPDGAIETVNPRCERDTSPRTVSEEDSFSKEKGISQGITNNARHLKRNPTRSGADEHTHPPASKRQRLDTHPPLSLPDTIASQEDSSHLSHEPNAAVLGPIPSEDTIPPSEPKPVIKPGQPAWVYKFDPAFIAEFQDVIEFI